jgi:hypothetical protein
MMGATRSRIASVQHFQVPAAGMPQHLRQRGWRRKPGVKIVQLIESRKEQEKE